MDNGWEILSEKEEIKRKKFDNVLYKMLLYAIFPILFCMMFLMICVGILSYNCGIDLW
jgi:hypothetical protein